MLGQEGNPFAAAYSQATNPYTEQKGLYNPEYEPPPDSTIPQVPGSVARPGGIGRQEPTAAPRPGGGRAIPNPPIAGTPINDQNYVPPWLSQYFKVGGATLPQTPAVGDPTFPPVTTY